MSRCSSFAMLTDRKNKILNLIVDEYVSTAAPVASSTVAGKPGLNVSSATVRNEIAELEYDGYVVRPHASSGAVPSDHGYRRYVLSIEPDVAPAAVDARRVDEELGPTVEDIDRWADAASSALAFLLNTLAFTTPPRDSGAAVRSVELVRLREMVVMLVLILQEASVYRHLITLSEPVTARGMDVTRQRVNEALAGKTAVEIAGCEIGGGEALAGQVRDSALEMLRKHDDLTVRETRMQGLSRLFDQPELTGHPARRRMALAAIEDADTIVGLADAAGSDGSVSAIIGSENSHESLRTFSVVMCRYGSPGQAGGLVGMIAPTRMQYSRAIPLVRYTAAALGGFATRLDGS